MTRILRARTAGKQPTIPRSTNSNQAIQVSKNILRPVPMFKARIQSVRVLFQPDPNNYNKNSTKTQATFSPVADQVMSTNPNFDPSRAPGSVTELAVSKATQTPGKASRGHQKTIGFSQLIKNGGKTLKRR